MRGTRTQARSFALQLLYQAEISETAEFHLTEDTLALHLLLECAQGLVDIVVADDDFDDGSILLRQIRLGLTTHGFRVTTTLPRAPLAAQA